MVYTLAVWPADYVRGLPDQILSLNMVLPVIAGVSCGGYVTSLRLVSSTVKWASTWNPSHKQMLATVEESNLGWGLGRLGSCPDLLWDHLSVSLASPFSALSLLALFVWTSCCPRALPALMSWVTVGPEKSSLRWHTWNEDFPAQCMFPDTWASGLDRRREGTSLHLRLLRKSHICLLPGGFKVRCRSNWEMQRSLGVGSWGLPLSLQPFCFPGSFCLMCRTLFCSHTELRSWHWHYLCGPGLIM